MLEEKAFALLGKFYPPEGLFLEETWNFSVVDMSVRGTFTVPENAAYSIIPLDYVTAEQYVRCFSQLSYALMYMLSLSGDIGSYVSPDEFVRLMCSGQMWYRYMNMRFLKRVSKGKPFNLHIKLAKIRKVKRFGVASLVASGPVAIDSEFVIPIEGWRSS